MPNPTRQEIIDAYKALEELYDWALEWAGNRAHSRYGTIHEALPPKPQPTMAEIEWDDDKHYLAEAEHPEYGKVIMLFKNRFDWISCFYQERSALFSEDPSLLTPTGERYTLTEVQE